MVCGTARATGTCRCGSLSGAVAGQFIVDAFRSCFCLYGWRQKPGCTWIHESCHVGGRCASGIELNFTSPNMVCWIAGTFSHTTDLTWFSLRPSALAPPQGPCPNAVSTSILSVPHCDPTSMLLPPTVIPPSPHGPLISPHTTTVLNPLPGAFTLPQRSHHPTAIWAQRSHPHHVALAARLSLSHPYVYMKRNISRKLIFGLDSDG